MARRPSQRAFVPSEAPPSSAVARYGAAKGWTLGRRTLLVEGTTDAEYFQLASSLSEDGGGPKLIDDELRVVAAGFGDDGGVSGVVREFLKLHGMMEVDLSLPRSQRRRILPIFDDDHAGRRYFNAVTREELPFRQFRDVLLLQRAYPPLKLGSPNYSEHLNGVNAEWKGLDCEIEDLLSRDLLDMFVSEHRSALKQAPVRAGDAHHYEFNNHAKGPLLRFARELATIEDVTGIISVLRYYRSLFDLL